VSGTRDSKAGCSQVAAGQNILLSFANGLQRMLAMLTMLTWACVLPAWVRNFIIFAG
jgi:hypothetical protein